MHLVVYLPSSLYSTPVCRFRHMSYGKFLSRFIFLHFITILYFMLLIVYVFIDHNFTFYCEYNRSYVYTATTWSRTAVTYYDVTTYTYFIPSQSLYIFIVWFYCIQTCLLPYWRWSGSERNIVAPWGWHWFAETCRSHRKRKIKKCKIQCSWLVYLYATIIHSVY
jgi:hypothetical protein